MTYLKNAFNKLSNTFGSQSSLAQNQLISLVDVKKWYSGLIPGTALKGSHWYDFLVTLG